MSSAEDIAKAYKHVCKAIKTLDEEDSYNSWINTEFLKILLKDYKELLRDTLPLEHDVCTFPGYCPRCAGKTDVLHLGPPLK